MWYYDLRYFLYVLPAYALVLIIQLWLKSTVKKYSKIKTAISGEHAAAIVLYEAGVSSVMIHPTSGDMTDNYDPSSNSINLSETSYRKYSVTSVGIAAHEAGHAVQHAEGYGPAKLRSAAVKTCKIGSMLSVPLMILGIFLSARPLIYAGIVCFSLVIIFQLITLPVEFNASKRAVKLLSSSGRFSDEEIAGVKKVLTAAAMTYVGALAVSMAQMLYYIARFRSRN